MRSGHALQGLTLNLGSYDNPSTWEDDEFQRRLLRALPEYRLSKFQPALPTQRSLEVVREYLLDVPQTLSYLGERVGPGASSEL